MKGKEQVISLLNRVLQKELTGINQYFIHAKMCQNWGYERLYKAAWDESIGEMKHADSVIERLLFLEGIPNMAGDDKNFNWFNRKQQLDKHLGLGTPAPRLL